MADIVEMAFGGGEDGGSGEPANDLAQAPTLDLALANINAALKFG